MAKTTPIKKVAGILGDSFDDLLQYADGQFDKRFYRAPNNQKQSPVYRPDTELVVPNDKFPRLAFQDLEGYPYMSTMADRLAANRKLTGIGGKELDIPINLTGGQGFMGFNEDLWISGVKPIQDMQKAAQEIKDLYGIDPLLMPFRMAPSGGDFAHATGQAMLSFASKYMNKPAKKDLDKKMKSVMPDWVGIDNPDMINQFSNLPDKQRKNLMKFMDTNYRNDGGISLGQARLAVSDQDQLKGIDMGFQNVGQLDLEKGINPTGGNLVYPSSFAGRSLGVVDQTDNIPTLLDLNPRKFNRAVFDQDQNVTSQYPQGGKKGEFKSGPQDGFAYLSDMTDKAASARSNIYGGLIDEPMIRSLQDRGFKIDANAMATLAALSFGGAAAFGSNKLYADGTPTGLLDVINNASDSMQSGPANIMDMIESEQYYENQYGTQLGVNPKQGLQSGPQLQNQDPNRWIPLKDRGAEFAEPYISSLLDGNNGTSQAARNRRQNAVRGLLEWSPTEVVDMSKEGYDASLRGDSFEGGLLKTLATLELMTMGAAKPISKFVKGLL
tara:strand:- start:636 stop:2294 length:1659 start_codon:yes stop_codon:yes gene_type:complete